VNASGKFFPAYSALGIICPLRQTLALSPGTRLGAYQILSLLGRGGMGEVYRACDTKLGRDVAIKVLPDLVANDAERLARFHREAEVLASLNHPHIAHIHGFEDSTGVPALVMELVEGPTLADRIAKGPLSIDEALPIARQIAEAVEAAHEQGIVHRDLKPANIKLRPDGTVKVLDFGLAKAIEPVSGRAATVTASPTITSPAVMTGVGMILGTAAYMSPEQAKGRPADRRADIWAFGCVLYEMLTRKRLFDGDDVSETIAAVLRAEPDWNALPPTTPIPIRTLLRRTLEKDPHQRLQHIGDARIEIEEARTGTKNGVATVSARGVQPAWIVAGASVLAATAIAALHVLEPPPPSPREMRVQITAPATFDSDGFALSPDGRYIVFVASDNGPRRLWLRTLDKTDMRSITGTDGASYPFWSADSRSLGFFASNKLYRVDIAGGPPQVLTDVADGRGGTWNPDGTILFARIALGPLMRIAAAGGEPTAVTVLDPPRQVGHTFPQFLPDGRHFLFYVRGAPGASGIYLGSLEGGLPKRLTAADRSGAYWKPGWLVFRQQGALVARRLKISQAELAGDPVTLADSVGAFSASLEGSVAYVGATGAQQLTWFDRTGKASSFGEPEANRFSSPELAPDDRRVVVDRGAQNSLDIWLSDLTRGGFTRFTTDPAGDQFPLWSPDGAQVVFASNRRRTLDLYLKPSSGGGAEELLLETANPKAPQDWSKDGRFLLYVEVDPKTTFDLWALEMEGNRQQRRPVVSTPFDERHGQFSPDGRWVAFQTNESGQFQVVVQPFPTQGGKWQVSINGGAAPRWRADGKELFFIDPAGRLMAVAVSATGSTFDVGKPVVLFQTRIVGGGAANLVKQQYAVSRDGRFLINQTVQDSATIPLTLILNWRPPINER
jgi:Tol biopolymer transport system component